MKSIPLPLLINPTKIPDLTCNKQSPSNAWIILKSYNRKSEVNVYINT